MAKPTEQSGESFMLKLARFIVDKRNLVFLVVIIGLIFSVFSRSWVQVENQLSAYLPKESETYKGLHLMEDEFTTFGTAKLMLVNVSYDEAQAVSEQIADIGGVQSVSFDDTRDHYTNASALYDITFDYSEDDDRCETVMNDIESALDGYDMYVSATFGDTASKTLAQEIGVIVIIVAIVVVSVLVLTSQTYAEVPVLLLTFIAAAVLNMGSNFLLGTISFVSNSVTIVLQLALSVDYAIILCNRYKEEHEKLPIREAVIVALSKAVPEICGSSLTTIGGLVAMLFMEFRLGFDLGICLIKSIFFSLFAVFFLMPGLLMLFGKKIDATRHKNFVPKIPFVGRFAYATKKIVPPIFLAVIIVAMLFANNCPYVYGFSYLKTTKQSAQQIADNMIDTTFGSSNMVAVVVPAGDYASEKKLLDELGTYAEVDSTLGLSNVEAMGGYMLTDALTPRQFSELTDLDYEVAELLYAAYAADGGNYGKIIGGLPKYSVPLIDMFTFLYGEMQDGYVSLEDAYSQITNAKKQLQSDDYSRMLVYLDLPVGGDETYNFLDQIRAVARSYYPDGDVYVVGDSSSEQDFKTSFSRDNVVVSVLSILIVLVVLLFTFKSAGIPVLLIVVIQGSIWINYGIPTITNSPLFFLSYLVVSSIQMGANIDYAIVTTSRFMEFKDKMPKKDAIIETMNLSFPTIITSGLMMAIAGILIGQMTSNAAIAGIGDSLGRGTILTIIIVMFILPQILLLGEKVIDKTAFDMPSAVSSHQSSGRVRIDGMVRGEIHGQISGVVHAVVEGDVNISLLSGTAEPETPPEEPGTPEVPVTAEEEDAEHE
mgnify:CR=1 FL=1